MTRERAIEILKRKTSIPEEGETFDEISEAFEMAIKALEQIPDLKEAYNKGYKDGQEALAFHLELCKEEQEPILDKIRDEIEHKALSGQWSDATRYGLLKAVAIIDKYKAESEDKE